MSDVDRVLGWFDSGRLVRPSADVLNFVDLTRALLAVAGARGIPESPGSREIARLIPADRDHYVFILVDGMGLSLLEGLSATGFLRSHVALRLQSVFPSTTAVALTTLATGQWPCVHGVPGWWTWLAEYGLTATMLPFVERTTERPLGEMGVSPEKAFPVPSVWPLAKHEPVTVIPSALADSVYSRYAAGNTPRAGYKDLPDAMSTARDRVLNARRPSLTYVYLPQLDDLCHHRGTRDEQAGQLLISIERGIEELAGALRGRARLIIGSDHGQTDVSAERKFILPESDPLRLPLVCQPTGEPQVPIFHVREGKEEPFAAEFAGRFGEFFALLTPGEVESLRLFGPGDLSPVMRRRLGTFVGVAPQPALFFIRPVSGSERHIGAHAGLTADEMHVPLILA